MLCRSENVELFADSASCFDEVTWGKRLRLRREDECGKCSALTAAPPPPQADSIRIPLRLRLRLRLGLREYPHGCCWRCSGSRSRALPASAVGTRSQSTGPARLRCAKRLRSSSGPLRTTASSVRSRLLVMAPFFAEHSAPIGSLRKMFSIRR